MSSNEDVNDSLTQLCQKIRRVALENSENQQGFILVRVIKSYVVNFKIDILTFFRADSESFGK